MKHNVVAPTVGESISEVRILSWRKKEGEAVKPGEVILEIESDKASVEVAAETNGALHILQTAGATVKVGEVIGEIDDAAKGSVAAAAPKSAPQAAPAQSASAAPAGASASSATMSPAVRRVVVETGVNTAGITGTGKDGRLTKGDVLAHVESGQSAPARTPAPVASEPSVAKPGERRVPMSTLRQRIGERLLEAQSNAALLTTFNECDMSAVMEVRAKYKESFKAKYGVNLSFMSFFTRACVLALKEMPGVNAFIEGTEIVYHDFCNVGIAVGTDRGLVVPVIRHAENLTFVEMEKSLGAMALKARDGKLGIADMSGGTFTISNGGTYGSLMSTPILNPPQSGILGMHKIMDRPIAVDGKVVIRPMMYLALTYDHRIIDGKEAVTFLIRVKEGIEKPTTLGMEFVKEL